jgi:uncharacterized protein
MNREIWRNRNAKTPDDQFFEIFTFDDITQELKKPGRDPRDLFKVFQFREDIHEVADLKDGMVCPGLVTNVTNFGAFVDIGVHQDGLVHISQLAHSFVDDPRKVVAPGDQVTVKVLGVDKDKNQISLTMLLEDRPERRPEPRPPAEPRRTDRSKEARSSGASAPRGSHNKNYKNNNRDRAGGQQKPAPHKGFAAGWRPCWSRLRCLLSPPL